MIPVFLLVLQSQVLRETGPGRLPNLVVRRKLSALPLSRIRTMTIIFIRSKVVETSVGYGDSRAIRRWATALARSTRLMDHADPGLTSKRPFEEGLVRFTLKSGRRVELPLLTENQVVPYWGNEVRALYDQAMDRLQKEIESTPPRADTWPHSRRG